MPRERRTRSSWIWVARAVILLALLFPFFFPSHFFQHFKAHFTGAIEGSMITGEWHIVVINIALFVSFLIPLSFRKKISWKQYGVVAAFFISLFVEMYGIPLTIMFFSKAFDSPSAASVDMVVTGKFLGVNFGLTLPMVFGAVLMALGTLIVIVGWVTLYRNIEKDGLVTSGIYSISRHPQYLGFLMVVLGWIIGWTTILTVVFGMILIVMYIHVSLKEEKEMEEDHDYLAYKKRTPFMI